uniref:tRNA:m(4)X modification enzyme TRM13 n=1 Tax=Timema poppense TaxID=170557 RepID=A0A7R9CL34_TIMPO|nr:unnamed protein product [Timema poppensis]
MIVDEINQIVQRCLHVGIPWAPAVLLDVYLNRWKVIYLGTEERDTFYAIVSANLASALIAGQDTFTKSLLGNLGTVSVAKLAKHLLKCNSRPTEKPQYVVPGINLYCGHLGLYSGDEVKKLSLSKIDDMELDLIIKKIKTLSAVSAALKGIKDIKELQFKGQLSYWLGAALHDKKECMLLLVDRASHRHKFDNRFKSVFHPRVCRVRTDIADLCLNNYDQVNAFENVVTIAKHLCGAATELHKCALVSQYDIDSYRSMVLLQLSLEFFVELYILIYIPSGVYAPTTNSEADLLTALERRHLQRIIGTADVI